MTNYQIALKIVQDFQEYLHRRGEDPITNPGMLAMLIFAALEKNDKKDTMIVGNP
jgi:transcriptional regulatory protein LevR